GKRIDLVAICAGKEKIDKRLNLFPRIDLRITKRRPEIIELIWIGLFAQDGRAIVVGEGCDNRLGVVLKIKNENIVLLRMRAIESRQCLYRLDPGKWLVHVHRVEQRLVVTGLELVRSNQKPIRLFLNLIRDIAAGKSVHG